MYHAGDKHFSGDEHFGDGDERVENALSNFNHTHTASYQWLPNKTYVKLISENGRYHAAEIQKVSRCTTMSSIALNWSSSK